MRRTHGHGWRRNATRAKTRARAALLAATAVGAFTAASANAADWQAEVLSDNGSNRYVTPVDTQTASAGTSLALNSSLGNIVIAADAGTAYAVDGTALDVIPLPPTSVSDQVSLPAQGRDVALTPDSATAYVTIPTTGSVSGAKRWSTIGGGGGGEIVPVTLGAAPSAGNAFNDGTAGGTPEGVAVSPNGQYLWVTDGNQVIPISLTGTSPAPGTPITLPTGSTATTGLVFTPDGSQLYVADGASGDVSVITGAQTASPSLLTSVTVGGQPQSLAVTPDGATVYVASSDSGGGIGQISTGASPALVGSVQTVTFPDDSGATPKALAITPNASALMVVDGATDVARVPLPLGTGTVTSAPLHAGTEALAITPDQAPAVDFSTPGGTPGSSVPFTATGGSPFGSIASYAWDFGDGSATVTTPDPSTSHTYAASGTYLASVTATSSGGTSTTRVFNGKQLLRNGGPSATAQHSVVTSNSATPGVTLSPPQLSFTQPGAPQKVVVTNSGQAPLHVAGVALGGLQPGAFAISGDGCSGQTIAPAASCTVAVSFTPTVAGVYGAVLAVSDDANGSPQTAGLSGTVQPGIHLSAASLDFGTVPIGNVVERTETVTNNGAFPLLMLNARTNSDEYTVATNGCLLQTVAPNGSCSVTVAFSPVALGPRPGRLTLYDNGPGNPQVVSLTANGAPGVQGLRGRVIDTTRSGNPGLPGITVLACRNVNGSCYGPDSKGTTSDSNGNYHLDGLSSGVWLIQVQPPDIPPRLMAASSQAVVGNSVYTTQDFLLHGPRAIPADTHLGGFSNQVPDVYWGGFSADTAIPVPAVQPPGRTLLADYVTGIGDNAGYGQPSGYTLAGAILFSIHYGADGHPQGMSDVLLGQINCAAQPRHRSPCAYLGGAQLLPHSAPGFAVAQARNGGVSLVGRAPDGHQYILPVNRLAVVPPANSGNPLSTMALDVQSSAPGPLPGTYATVVSTLHALDQNPALNGAAAAQMGAGAGRLTGSIALDKQTHGGSRWFRDSSVGVYDPKLSTNPHEPGVLEGFPVPRSGGFFPYPLGLIDYGINSKLDQGLRRAGLPIMDPIEEAAIDQRVNGDLDPYLDIGIAGDTPRQQAQTDEAIIRQDEDQEWAFLVDWARQDGVPVGSDGQPAGDEATQDFAPPDDAPPDQLPGTEDQYSTPSSPDVGGWDLQGTGPDGQQEWSAPGNDPASWDTPDFQQLPSDETDLPSPPVDPAALPGTDQLSARELQAASEVLASLADLSPAQESQVNDFIDALGSSDLGAYGTALEELVASLPPLTPEESNALADFAQSHISDTPEQRVDAALQILTSAEARDGSLSALEAQALRGLVNGIDQAQGNPGEETQLAPPEPQATPEETSDVQQQDTSGDEFSDVYIDPSGLVRTTRGAPVAGARVMLSHSATRRGRQVKVPSGSAIMSPGNRRNPDRTTVLGQFGWDVLPGFYRVSATKAGCRAAPARRGRTQRTKVLRIPPPVTNLSLKLSCPHLSRSPTRLKLRAVAGASGTAVLRAVVRPRHGHRTTPGTIVFKSGRTLLGVVAIDNPRTGLVYLPLATVKSLGRVTATYSGDGLLKPSSARAAP